MPTISVILPAYNCETYVATALDSILAQSMKDLEIIAVNDGSTDQTGDILDSYSQKDTRVRVFHTENHGVAEARNFALLQAKGVWLAFCDADDTVPSNAYQVLLKKSRGVDVVVGDFSDISDSYGEVTVSALSTCKTNFDFIFAIPCMWTKLIRNDFVRDHNLQFPSMRLGEDVLFLAALAAQHPSISSVRQVVYHHWFHDRAEEASLIHIYDLYHFRQHLMTRQELIRFCEQQGLREGYEYVYKKMSYFMAQYLSCMSSDVEQLRAFEEFREFILRYDWTKCTEYFQGLFMMSPKEMREISSFQYFNLWRAILPRDRVLQEFTAGMIGAKYIIKYIRAWYSFKVRRANCG